MRVLEITTGGLPGGVITSPVTPYAATLAQSGGDGSVTWSQISGSLPPGLALAASGIISGGPTTEGTFVFAVRFVDANGFSCSKSLSIAVTADNIWDDVVWTPISGAASGLGSAYSAAAAGPSTNAGQVNGSLIYNGPGFNSAVNFDWSALGSADFGGGDFVYSSIQVLISYYLGFTEVVLYNFEVTAGNSSGHVDDTFLVPALVSTEIFVTIFSVVSISVPPKTASASVNGTLTSL